MDEYIDYTGGQGGTNDANDTLHESTTSTRVGTPTHESHIAAQPEGSESDGASSDGFSSDISSIENNLGEYRIIFPGDIGYQPRSNAGSNGEVGEPSTEPRSEQQQHYQTQTPPERPEFDGIQFWRETGSSPHSDHAPGRRSSLDSNNSATTQITWIGDEADGERAEYEIAQVEFNGQPIQFAIDDGEPWFCLGTEEENQWHERLWRTGDLKIPGYEPPSLDGYDYYANGFMPSRAPSVFTSFSNEDAYPDDRE